VEDDGWLALFRVGYVNVYLAYLYAVVTPVTDIRIENHRLRRADDIG
jgi:hypothetical protein